MDTDAEIELQQCESCEKEFPFDQCTLMIDCWFCAGCVEEWQRHFDACQHEFEPYDDEQKVCRKCSGVVSNDWSADVAAATAALNDFHKNGGVSLDALKKDLDTP